LRNATLYALAQMYMIQENYDQALATLKTWFSVAGEDQPDGHALMAQVYYQKKNFKASEQSLLTSLRIAKQRQQQPKENWLALLRAVYYELKDYDKSARVLEVLVAFYPAKSTYWSQLAGMYGLLNRQKDQLIVLHTAYTSRLLTSESDLLNLARLYMLEDAPYPAILVLKRGFKEKVIKESATNLQLYAQALALAKEFEQQIPVLQQLAEMTHESKHYVYLGQAQGELNHWKEAAESFKVALNFKEVQKPATIRMQLGTALFNAGRLKEAREVFAVAAESEEMSKQASNWIKFINSEIQKKEALQAG
jgi:tetratricopeptide (TPR) repeat protein